MSAPIQLYKSCYFAKSRLLVFGVHVFLSCCPGDMSPHNRNIRPSLWFSALANGYEPSTRKILKMELYDRIGNPINWQWNTIYHKKSLILTRIELRGEGEEHHFCDVGSKKTKTDL